MQIEPIITEETSMKIAQRCAKAAACLDDLHTAEVDGATYWQSRKAADKHIAALHDLAQFFAGARANEIYAPDEPVNLLSLEAAARLSTATQEEPACATS